MKLVVFTYVLFFCVFCNGVPAKSISAYELNRGAVALDGMWAFDWKERHIQFDRPVKDVINLPGLWHQQGDYTPQGYGTLRLHLKLPEVGKYYLRIPDVPSAVALWVNGELLFQRGLVSDKFDTEVAKFSPEVVQLPANDSYEVILHVSNYHHKEGGVWHRFLIANADHQYALGSQNRLIDAMVFSFLMVVSIYLLLINLSRKGSLSHILFAGFIWVIACRSVMVGERIAYVFIHDVSWLAWQRTEHILLFLSLPLFIYFFQRFFSLKNQWLAHSVLTVSVVMIVMTLTLPAHIFTQLGLINQILGLLSVVYILVMLTLLIKQKADYSVVFLASFIVWVCLMLHDYLYTHQWIQSRPLAQFGLIAFVVFQLVILWNRRKQESKLMMYVRGIIDHQVKEVEASTKSIKDAPYEINEFVKDLRPYLQVLNISINHESSHELLDIPRDKLKRIVFMLARMAEREGKELNVRIYPSDSKQCMEMIFSIKRPWVMQEIQSQEFNAAIYTLHQLGLVFTQMTKIDLFSIRISLPFYKASNELEKENINSKKQFGIQAGIPILIASEQMSGITLPLQDYFCLIRDEISSLSVSKHRPKLIIWQVTEWTDDVEYKIKNIRHKYTNLPILLIVDGFYKTQLAKCIQLGITDYLTTPFMPEELILKVQRLMDTYVEISAPQILHDIRDVTVSLVRMCIDLWQKHSGKSKTELADASRLWRVYVDGSTAKTRTLDKYLSVQTLPKNPRWETVSRTAQYVLDQCQLEDRDKQILGQKLSLFNQLLARHK